MAARPMRLSVRREPALQGAQPLGDTVRAGRDTTVRLGMPGLPTAEWALGSWGPALADLQRDSGVDTYLYD